jgi:hypothetical protein
VLIEQHPDFGTAKNQTARAFQHGAQRLVVLLLLDFGPWQKRTVAGDDQCLPM